MSTDSLRARLSLIGATITLAQVRERFAKGKADQPRVPAGGPHGGEWTSGGAFVFGGLYGLSDKPPKYNPNATTHPRKNDKGEAVTIEQPTAATDPDTWHAADKTATFVPDGKTPKSLMGVALKPWTPPNSDAGWARVEGQDPHLEAAPPTPVRGKSIAAGVIVMEPDGRIWTVRPTNGWAGYINTFPKGTQESGLSLQATAIKEMYEETGLKVKLTGLLGDFERTGSVSRYYIGVRTGGTPARMGWEAQAVRLSPASALPKLLNNSVDRRIATALARESSIGKSFDPTKHPRWPAGTPLGGQFMGTDDAGVVKPPVIGGGAGNPQYQKKADLLYTLAQSGDTVALKQHADALAAKVAAAQTKAKQNSHDAWNAKLAQYAQSLVESKQQGTITEAKTDKVDGPMKLADMTLVAPKPGGQSPGAIYTDANGTKWLVKGNAQKVSGNVSETQSDDRARNEVAAAHLFNAAGTQAPVMKLVELGTKYGGGLGVASQMIDGMSPLNVKDPQHLAAAQQTFGAQAWLRNHDALGNSNDNITISQDGKGIAVDPGGALMFKGWGLPKPDGVPDSPSEWTTMRDKNKAPTAAPVFGSMTKDQLTASAFPLANVTDKQITSIIDTYGPGNKDAKAKLANSLMARRDGILELAGLDKSGMPLAPAVSPPPPPPPPTPAAAASAATASASQFPIPKFSSGFASANAVYEAHAKAMLASHAAGDAANIGVLLTAAGASNPQTASGKLLNEYAGKLVNDLNAKATAAVSNPATPASIAPNPAVAPQGTAKAPNLPAMPVFDSYKISEANKNAGSHNPKVDMIKTLAQSGNVNALLAMNYSINTYGVKQVALANEVLAALGSKEQVVAGQKKGTHPSLAGNIQGKQVAEATANLAEAGSAKVHTLDTTKLPKPPDYNTSGPGGKPMHGAQWKNDANNAEGAVLHGLAMGPNPIDALKAYTLKSPSKYLAQYKDDLLSEIDTQLHPPEPIKVLDHSGSLIDGVSLEHIKPAYAVGTGYTKIKPHERLAFYVALAVVKSNINWSDAEHNQSQEWVDAGYKEFKASSSVTQKGILAQQSTPSQFRDIKLSDQVGGTGATLQEMMEHWNKDAKVVPTSTKLYRYVHFSTAMIDQLLATEPGTVVADLSPQATSRDNGRNKGFGKVTGKNSKIEFVAMDGVRAMKSYGSTKFDGEMETTLMPGQRFMIHKVRQRSDGTVKIKAILLPTQSPV